MKQDNDLHEIRSTITVLSKTFRTGVIICKKSATKEILIETTDEDKKEDLQ